MKGPDTEKRALRIIERLKMFNRKERDHLMKFALCEQPAAPQISTDLWETLSNGGTKPNPDRMFIGMDYHLNWLYAALATSDPEMEDEVGSLKNSWNFKSAPESTPILGNQEDVDLLVAWFDQRWRMPFRLYLVEAKLDSPWRSDQLHSKVDRLALIQADAMSQNLDFINWHLRLLSPNPPKAEVIENARKRHQEKASELNLPKVRRMSIDWADWTVSGGEHRVNRLKENHGFWKVEKHSRKRIKSRYA